MNTFSTLKYCSRNLVKIMKCDNKYKSIMKYQEIKMIFPTVINFTVKVLYPLSPTHGLT